MDGNAAPADLRQLLEARAYDRALAWMHHHHEGDLLAVLRAEHVPPGEREDLAQTVWLAVQQALPRYRAESSPATWLAAIARHRILDWRRRNRVLETLTSEQGPGGPLFDLLGLTDPRTPSSEARGKQRQEQLRRALTELSLEEMALVELRFAEGLIPQQIAEHMDRENRRRPDGAPYTAADISQRLHRALQKLRRHLSE